MEIELEEENVKSPNAKDANIDNDQSNPAELKSLVPLSANNDKDANRQKINTETGNDHLNDRAVGLPSKHSGLAGATMNFVNSMLICP